MIVRPHAPSSLALALCCSAAVACAGAPAVPPAEFPPDAGVAPPDGGVVDRCQRAWHGDQQFGTAQDDAVADLALDADDGLLLAGSSGAVGLAKDTEGARAFVQRWSPEGDPVWTQPLETGTSDVAEALVVDGARGELHVAGRTRGAFGNAVNQGQYDLFVATLDLAGALRSVHQQGSAAPQAPQRIALHASGGLVVAGYDDVFVPTNYVEAWEDPFVGLLARGDDGHWTPAPLRYFGSAGTDFVFAAATDAQGSIYLGGNVASGARRGAFVEKQDAQGNVLWHRTLSAVGVDAVRDLLVTPAGDVLAVGGSFTALAPTLYGGQDAFVAALDPAGGGLKWAAQYGGEDADLAKRVVLDHDGNVYVAGETLSSLAPGFHAAGDYDVFALRFSPTGTLTGVWQDGTSGDDTVNAIQVDSCGNVVVAGYASGPFVPGATYAGGRDAYVRRITFAVP